MPSAVAKPAQKSRSRLPLIQSARDLRIAQAGVSEKATIASESPSAAPRTSGTAIKESLAGPDSKCVGRERQRRRT
jgi:hypothetical protein